MLGRISAIHKVSIGLALCATAAVGLAACGTSSTTASGPSCPNTTSLSGAGSTFINPLMSKRSEQYVDAHCGAQVSYQSVGSGAGITLFLRQTVDFGATDSAMKADQIARSEAGAVLHLPATIGGVASSCRVPEVAA